MTHTAHQANTHARPFSPSQRSWPAHGVLGLPLHAREVVGIRAEVITLRGSGDCKLKWGLSHLSAEVITLRESGDCPTEARVTQGGGVRWPPTTSWGPP